MNLRFRLYHLERKQMLYGGDEKFYVSLEGKVLNSKLEDITDKVVISRFSGHYDKNRVGVWEGDLLRDDKGNLHKVKFEEGSFVTIEQNKPEVTYFTFRFNDLEVVGNVWENNPEKTI